MSRLALVFADLHAMPLSPETCGGLPRLAALEFLLARAEQRPVAGGWRNWLGLIVGGEELAEVAPAGVAAFGRAVLTPSQYWFATPVHYVAGIDTVRLHSEGLLRLSAEHQQLLMADFLRTFEGAGWTLLPTGRRELLLAGPRLRDAATQDPALVLGADPSSALPRGADSATLRRLGAELELWMHEHVVNRERQRVGELPVTGFWIWGGGEVPGAARASDAVVLAEDAYADGLARLTGNTLRALPAGFSMADLDQNQDTIVVLPLAGGRVVGELQRVEQQWMLPLLEQWRSGRWQQLTLQAGARMWHLPARARWRWWRRTRPWWESLLC